MGWDNDKSGDYVPSPPPTWLWVLVGLAAAGFLTLLVFGAG